MRPSAPGAAGRRGRGPGLTQAPDLPTLEANLQEAIRGYLQTAEPEEPLPDFVGTWRVEVTT